MCLLPIKGYRIFQVTVFLWLSLSFSLSSENYAMFCLLYFLNVFKFKKKLRRTAPCGMWDLSSQTQDGTCALYWRCGVLTSGPPEKSLKSFFLNCVYFLCHRVSSLLVVSQPWWHVWKFSTHAFEGCLSLAHLFPICSFFILPWGSEFLVAAFSFC